MTLQVVHYDGNRLVHFKEIRQQNRKTHFLAIAAGENALGIAFLQARDIKMVILLACAIRHFVFWPPRLTVEIISQAALLAQHCFQSLLMNTILTDPV